MVEVQQKNNSLQRRILVAEDNPTNQVVLLKQLEVLGYQADLAGNGAVALSKWKSGGYDLLLADRHMPEMDGLALARAIRSTERETGTHIPIIAITSIQYPDELALSRQAGMDDILSKPIKLDDLRHMLEHWLSLALSAAVAKVPPKQSASPDSKTVLDTSELVRLVGKSDTKQIRDLVDLFTATARTDWPLCRKMLREHDEHGLALVMHKLKSSALMIGAERFAAYAEKLENVAKAGRLDDASFLFAELEQALKDVESTTVQLILPTAPIAPDIGVQTMAGLGRVTKSSASCPASMNAESIRQSMVVTADEILDGIHQNEFEIHFQPKVDAVTLRVVGVEALARWRHRGNQVPPDVFIASAERHGLIGQLSEVLVIKALIGGAQLAEAGFPLVVAVKLSANWLTDIGLPEFILAGIQVTDLRIEDVILEIAETGAIADIGTVHDVMARLRLKGFKLSLNTFETGYSTMEQLRSLLFNELKLHRSLVRSAEQNSGTRATLASDVEMVAKLKLSTVAEGVETLQDLSLARGLGCDLVQGWFIAKAMPVAELISWLKSRVA